MRGIEQRTVDLARVEQVGANSAGGVPDVDTGAVVRAERHDAAGLVELDLVQPLLLVCELTDHVCAGEHVEWTTCTYSFSKHSSNTSGLGFRVWGSG